MTEGCPGGFLDYAPPPALERVVAARPPITVRVMVTGRELENGYQRLPFEHICQGHSCFEVSALLFVNEGLLSQPDLRAALEETFGLNLPEHPNEPGPDLTPKPTVKAPAPAPTVAVTLLSREICIVVEGGDSGVEQFVEDGARTALRAALPGITADVVADCGPEYLAPEDWEEVPPVSATDLSDEGARGLVVYVPERWPFSFPESVRRVVLNGACDVSGCREDVAGVYVNPGLLDNAPALTAALEDVFRQ